MNQKQELQHVLHDMSSDSVAKYLNSLCNVSTSQFHIQLTQIISQDVHFDPILPHKPAHQIRISFCSLSHIPLVSPLSIPANILCLTVRTGVLRTFDSYCHTFKTFFSLYISISIFCPIFLIGLTFREVYILDILQNITREQ